MLTQRKEAKTTGRLETGILIVVKRVPLKDKSVGKLKSLLDAEFSKYMRRNYSEDSVTVDCFTCGINKPIKDMHNGHYVPRTQSPTRYSEANCRPQCPGCNTFRSGMPHEFRRNLCIEIGDDAVEAMEEESRQPWKWSRVELAAKIGYYKQLNKDF